MASRKRPSVEERVDQLESAGHTPDDPQSAALIEAALADKNWLVVASAADIVARQQLERYQAALTGVWARFADGSAKTDPGCRAKLAALTALDRLEQLDPEPFLPATRYRQLEPVYGGKVETAGPVRVRAVSALLRMHYTDGALIAGELLAEGEREVRAGVAQALGYYGVPGAEALLAHRLAADQEPAVLSECASALLRLNTDYAVPRLVAWLAHEDVMRREVASVALGQHEDGRAVAALIEWLAECALESDIELAVQALGLSRQPRAREFLLQQVAEGSRARARAAVRALSVHRYDTQLRERVLAAADASAHDDLPELVEEAFSER
jgi:HEAT repeat protein